MEFRYGEGSEQNRELRVVSPQHQPPELVEVPENTSLDNFYWTCLKENELIISTPTGLYTMQQLHEEFSKWKLIKLQKL